MQVSAKVDYGLRAMLELAARSQGDTNDLASAEELAEAQGIPGKFLEGILNQLRRSGLVISRRGAEGGYRLAKPADQITFAEVIRAIEGPLAGVRGVAPEDAEYEGAAEHMREVWIATRVGHARRARIRDPGRCPDRGVRLPGGGPAGPPGSVGAPLACEGRPHTQTTHDPGTSTPTDIFEVMEWSTL